MSVSLFCTFVCVSLLRTNERGAHANQDHFVRSVLRTFPYAESQLLQQMVVQLAKTPVVSINTKLRVHSHAWFSCPGTGPLVSIITRLRVHSHARISCPGTGPLVSIITRLRVHSHARISCPGTGPLASIITKLWDHSHTWFSCPETGPVVSTSTRLGFIHIHGSPVRGRGSVPKVGTVTI